MKNHCLKIIYLILCVHIVIFLSACTPPIPEQLYPYFNRSFVTPYEMTLLHIQHTTTIFSIPRSSDNVIIPCKLNKIHITYAPPLAEKTYYDVLGYIPKNTRFVLVADGSKEIKIKFENGKYKGNSYIFWDAQIILKDILHFKNKKALRSRFIKNERGNEKYIKELVEVDPITHRQMEGDRNNFCNFLENKAPNSKYFGFH